MRKPVFPRILGLLVLYCAVFAALVLIQFGKGNVRQTGAAQKKFNPADFVITQAQSAQTFNEALDRWRDQSFAFWSRTAARHSDEDTVIAYNADSVRRGVYRTATASTPAAFRSGSRRSYRSSVYLGGMAQAQRSFTAAEQETLSRLSRLISEKSLDILKENRVFEFLLLRGLTDQVTGALESLRSIDAAVLTLEYCPGIFEAYADVRSLFPQAENPLEPLIAPACNLVAGGLVKDAERDTVLAYRDGAAESELNLRLGKALWTWAGDTGGDWAALGRSLVLSVLSLADDSGAVPALVPAEGGETSEDTDNRISAALLYRILNPGEFYPRAAAIVSGADNIWAWTASPLVSAAQNGESLDISVSFPVNETHYMIIRGLRPFVRLQLYNIDYRSDPQFERYDSSGWVYYPDDQILVLKMKHRTAVEHIRIFFREQRSASASGVETLES
ncbi:MAG: hypothetical protein LBS37_06995 [Treponema sp.]|jgi:hypothetical protein|nr:hypothetical protein [Treponema sp.]